MADLFTSIQLTMRLILASILVMGSFIGNAQIDDSDTTAVLLEDVMIQTDVFGNSKTEFAGSVSAIAPDQIQRAEGLYLNSVINSIPGVFMQSGALNTNRITIRGVGSRSPFATNKIKAYLDEIPLSTGDGETTIEDIDFATLGGIEVYRGPSSTLYGAGLGGAIHMRTGQPGKFSQVFSELAVGSFGLRRLNAGAEVSDGQKAISAFYQDVHSDGYRENNEYDRKSLTLMGKTSVGPKSTISTYLNLSNLNAHIPSSLNKALYDSIPTAAESRWAAAEGFEDNDRVRLGASLITDWNNRTKSTLAVFGSAGHSDELRATHLSNIGLGFSNFGFRGTLKQRLLPEKNLSLVAGFELFQEKYNYREYENLIGSNGERLLNFEQDRNYTNLFLISEYRPTPTWIISLGGNVNLSNYISSDQLPSDTTDFSHDFSFGSIFSPKVSITKLVTSEISLYGLVSHGFSLPTFDQTIYPQLDDGNDRINENISEESGFNFELGFKGHVFDRRLYFELAAYAMSIDDMLVTQSVDGGEYSVNAGSADYQGLELLIDHAILRTPKLRLDQRLSISLMNYTFEDFIHDDNDFSGNTVTGVPDRTIEYQLSGRTGMGLYGNLVVQHVGEIYARDDNTESLDSYSLLNLKLGFARDLDRFTIDGYVGVNNLLDEKYASMVQPNAFGRRYYYPGLPINFYTGLKLAYRL